MFKIVDKKELAQNVKLLRIIAPEIANSARAGQFVIIRIDEKGERIPLTLVDWDTDNGTIIIIFQEVGLSTKKLGDLEIGEEISNLIGPLGNPSEIKNYGTVAVVCGGVGTAAAYPIARALKEAGNAPIRALLSATSKSVNHGHLWTIVNKKPTTSKERKKLIKTLLINSHRNILKCCL